MFILWISMCLSNFMKFPSLPFQDIEKPKCRGPMDKGERGGSVVECRTPEREVRGSRPTSAVLCPWARHFTPRKYWLITQEAMAPSRYDWKIVDWDVKPQHNQPTNWWTKWKRYIPAPCPHKLSLRGYKYQMSSTSSQIGSVLCTLEHWKNFWDYNGKMISPR